MFFHLLVLQKVIADAAAYPPTTVVPVTDTSTHISTKRVTAAPVVVDASSGEQGKVVFHVGFKPMERK